MRFPAISGNVLIRDENGSVIIAGDPEGLRSLGRLISWLADADQDEWPHLPEGGRAHVHLYPKADLGPQSRPAELARLDEKGTGFLPGWFMPK